jgi:ribosomal RNA-processing protein 8
MAYWQYHQTHRALTSAWPSPPLPHIIARLAPLPAKTLIVDLGCGDAGLARALVPQGKIVLSYDLVGDSGKPGSAPAADAGGWVCEADFLEHVPLPGRPGGLSASTGAGGAGGEAGSGNGELSKSKKRRMNREKNKLAASGAGNASASEVVDVVVCCLSLMGTNWLGGIYEACRVLKQG